MATVEITALVPIVMPRPVRVARSALRESALQAMCRATMPSRAAFIVVIVTTRRCHETRAVGRGRRRARLAGPDPRRSGAGPPRDAAGARCARRLRRRAPGRDEPVGPRLGLARLRPPQPQ